MNVQELLKSKKNNFQPIEYLEVESNEYRFNLVTDSLMSHSLFGGVATALILAVSICNRNHWPLRIITRTTDNNPVDFELFLAQQNLKKPEKVEYYSDFQKNEHVRMKLEVSEKDIFFATSWWSAAAIRSCNLRKRFFWIIQEEETFFYPYGDDRLWCEEMMHSDDVDFIVNTKLLYDYFRQHEYVEIVENGCFFEPAFSKSIYYADENTFTDNGKYKLFYYGRPNNPRNLFYHGLEFLDEAIMEGILNTNEWDICLAGGNCPEFTFSNGAKPIYCGVMSWEKYAAFARTVDLSFSLMYTPHPSYPPFDMSCSGAVVLTNNFKNKRELNYSDNWVTVDLNKECMMDGFRQAIRLAKNMELRKQNYERNRILTDWNKSFSEVFTFMESRVERG